MSNVEPDIPKLPDGSSIKGDTGTSIVGNYEYQVIDVKTSEAVRYSSEAKMSIFGHNTFLLIFSFAKCK